MTTKISSLDLNKENKKEGQVTIILTEQGYKISSFNISKEELKVMLEEIIKDIK